MSIYRTNSASQQLRAKCGRLAVQLRPLCSVQLHYSSRDAVLFIQSFVHWTPVSSYSYLWSLGIFHLYVILEIYSWISWYNLNWKGVKAESNNGGDPRVWWYFFIICSFSLWIFNFCSIVRSLRLLSTVCDSFYNNFLRCNIGNVNVSLGTRRSRSMPLSPTWAFPPRIYKPSLNSSTEYIHLLLSLLSKSFKKTFFLLSIGSNKCV